MDKALDILKYALIIAVLIYFFGFIFGEDFFIKISKSGEKLVPYGIKILHLR
ncbi:MAG: hypothetical protein ACP5JU_02400 [Minisyncoccia bacterium]